MEKVLFTIGHSSHEFREFLELLEAHGVDVICDVRSSPYSGRNPQFNREALRDALAERTIQYVFLGKELGARSEDLSCYVDGQARYERIAETDLFRSGLERVLKGVESFRVSLMCAESDPLTCHRTILVCRELKRSHLSIFHILPNGTLESHGEAEERLLRMTKLDNGDLFRARDELLEEAYRLQGTKIAYSRPMGETSSSSSEAAR